MNLGAPAKMLAERFCVDLQIVANLCPVDLVGVAGNYGRRFSREEIDLMMLEWHRKVEKHSMDVHRASRDLDKKRLKYFRRRYGPHITMEHLPRSAK